MVKICCPVGSHSPAFLMNPAFINQAVKLFFEPVGSIVFIYAAAVAVFSGLSENIRKLCWLSVDVPTIGGGIDDAAGAQAGRMRQSARMWVLLPRDYPLPQ